MFAHVIARIRSNNFVEDYSCTMCEDVYPKIVADKLERAWDKPKRLYLLTSGGVSSGGWPWHS
jgi:hypothetical protein